VPKWKRILQLTVVGMAVAVGSALTSTARSAVATDGPILPRPPACEGELELIAIVYVAEDPARSMALVGIKGSSLVRVGSWIGDRRVLDMGPRSLVLGPTDDACLVRLTERSPRRPTRPPRRRRGRSKRR
jgi:hypothetical protein